MWALIRRGEAPLGVPGVAWMLLPCCIGGDGRLPRASLWMGAQGGEDWTTAVML